MTHAEKSMSYPKQDWPVGGGKMGELIRTKDWSETPLGNKADWPQSLRTALDICLGLRTSASLCWGNDLIMLYNDAWRDLLDKQHLPALGRPAREVFSEVWQKVGPNLDQVFATGEVMEYKDQLLPFPTSGHLDKSHCSYTFNPVFGEDGSVGGITIHFNVDWRKQIQKELRENERYLSAIFQNSPECIKVVAADGTLLQINPAGLSMVEAESDSDVVGRCVYDLIVPEHRQKFREFNERICRGESGTLQFDITSQQGTRRQMETHAAPLHRPDGTIAQLAVTRDVTERKKAETALARVTKESERQKRLYEAIISSTPDLVYVFDLNYRFIFVNDALLKMWGKTLEESLGKSLLEIGYEPWHAEMHEREIDQVIATKQPVRGEVPFPHATLGERIYDYIFVPVLNDEGKVEAIAGTTRDITERKQAETALFESEKKYRTLFDSIDEGFCIIQMLFDEDENPVDYRFLEVNPAFDKQTGLKDVEGKRARELSPNIEEHWFETYGKVALTGEPIRFEHFTERSGQRWYNVYAFRYGPPENRQVAILFRNITERKQDEHTAALLSAIVDSSEDAIISKNLNSVITSWNAGAERLFGYTAGEAIERSVTMLIPDDRLYEETEIISQLKRNERIEQLETVRQRKDGTLLDVSLTISPVRDSTGRIVGASKIARDITKRKQTEKKLQRMNETLEERVAERTAALVSYQDQLRSLASELSKAEERERQRLATELHDNLGQILTMCKIKLDLFRRDGLPDQAVSDVTELTGLMDEAIRYTRELMSDLKPPPTLDKEDLAASLQWVAGKMGKHGLKVSLEDDGQPKPLSEEVRTTLRQCVRELLFNVVKHAGVDRARVVLARRGERVQVSVKDRGKGFNMEGKKPQPTEEGGFGLFSIRERIDLLGGSMKVLSKLGEGTKVMLSVPLKEKKVTSGISGPDSRKTSRSSRVSAPSESGHIIKILLADDHQMVRTGLRKMIEGESDLAVIAEASDGAEAVELARTTSPDVVVMDVNMPGMNGIDATRKIASEVPHIRIIGLSLHDKDNVSQTMLDAGASAYLTKSEVYETLCATIRSEATMVKE